MVGVLLDLLESLFCLLNLACGYEVADEPKLNSVKVPSSSPSRAAEDISPISPYFPIANSVIKFLNSGYLPTLNFICPSI